jgi:hypothetical protein
VPIKKADFLRSRLLKKGDRLILPTLRAGVAEVGLRTKLWWELGQALTRIHLDAVISSTTGVGGLESSVVSRAMEGDELIEAVTDTLKGAASAVNETVGPTSFAAVGVCLADDLLRDLDHSVEDVTESAAKFPR